MVTPKERYSAALQSCQILEEMVAERPNLSQRAHGLIKYARAVRSTAQRFFDPSYVADVPVEVPCYEGPALLMEASVYVFQLGLAKKK